MSIIIRQVKKIDLTQIRKLANDYGRLMNKVAENTISGFGDWAVPDMRNFFSEALHKKHKLFLVAVDKQKIIGFMLVRIIFHKEGKKIYPEGKLSETFIVENYRGKGIAETMWQQALKWFKENKVKVLQLHVFAGNTKPIAIYKKWGFKPMGIIMKRKI